MNCSKFGIRDGPQSFLGELIFEGQNENGIEVVKMGICSLISSELIGSFDNKK